MATESVTIQPVGGRYELRELLGRGGMGSVWRGEDLLLQRPVAVKRVELPVHLPPGEREALRQRVLREARAAARVGHPRLVTIFDVVEEEGTVFLVQELVDAPTLKQLVTEHGPFSPAEVARIGAQLADGLAAAHAGGVVHRDEKPSNVMVREDGSVKLADFGIASVSGDPQLTATGVVIGSPAYMAPEQATGHRVTAAADVWSLGATLYFAVEGAQPFGKSDTLSTLTAVVHEPPRPTQRAGALAAVLGSLLDKDAETRPTITEAARLLDGVPAEADETATAAMTEATVAAHRMVEERDQRVDPSASEDRRRFPLGAVAALLVFLLVGGLVLAALLGNRKDTGRDAVGASGDPTTTTDAPTTAEPMATTATTVAATTDAKEAVPAGWQTYADDRTGYRLAYPAGWKPTTRSGNRTDFVDPSTGTYLRVDWTDTPGDSAQADWERQSGAFGKTHAGYHEIGIHATNFAGSSNASLWEYTYTAGGATLHAYDLGFVLPNRAYGFALNLQTREDRWAATQGTWEQLKAGFVPPQ
ncbi:MAG TPA: serine/threonine-protein kinase [Acidimicrobiales bacterium]|nr:serine/threonine-protein kinase [Acidimicrobiales bacterium]